ncbi:MULTISPECIES: hypothetical protein [Streptomyces]|uniref:Integral membrane protein n=1 Tax=Streptomyces ramulosus TaxID=47762 RepID=A0ABW1FV02_9ACTN
MLRDLRYWTARRPLRVPEGRQHILHSSSARMTILAFTGTDVLVALLIDAKLPPAGRAVHILWVVFSLTLSLGICAMTARAPHLLDDNSLHLRTGPFRALTLPLAAVSKVSVAHRYIPGHGLRRVPDSAEEVACSVGGATHLVIELRQPVLVRVRKGEPVLAKRVCLAADEPSQATRLISQSINRDAQS